MEKPKIKLNFLEKNVVNTRNQKEYTELMRVLECGDCKWLHGNLPTHFNIWPELEDETGINISPHLMWGKKKHYLSRPEFFKVVPPEEYYKKQGITKEQILEINSYFDSLKKTI